MTKIVILKREQLSLNIHEKVVILTLNVVKGKNLSDVGPTRTKP